MFIFSIELKLVTLARGGLFLSTKYSFKRGVKLLLNRNAFVISILMFIFGPVLVFVIANILQFVANMLFNSLEITLDNNVLVFSTYILSLIIVLKTKIQVSILNYLEKVGIFKKLDQSSKYDKYFNIHIAVFSFISIMMCHYISNFKVDDGSSELTVWFIMIVLILVLGYVLIELLKNYKILFIILREERTFSIRDICIAFFSIYISTGVFFSMIYSLERLQLFSFLSGTKSFFDYFYFSFVTLATIGYGDIVPVDIGKLIVIMESAVGLFLTAITIGLIMNYFSVPSCNKDKSE